MAVDPKEHNSLYGMDLDDEDGENGPYGDELPSARPKQVNKPYVIGDYGGDDSNDLSQSDADMPHPQRKMGYTNNGGLMPGEVKPVPCFPVPQSQLRPHAWGRRGTAVNMPRHYAQFSDKPLSNTVIPIALPSMAIGAVVGIIAVYLAKRLVDRRHSKDENETYRRA